MTPPGAAFKTSDDYVYALYFTQPTVAKFTRVLYTSLIIIANIKHG